MTEAPDRQSDKIESIDKLASVNLLQGSSRAKVNYLLQDAFSVGASKRRSSLPGIQDFGGSGKNK